MTNTDWTGQKMKKRGRSTSETFFLIRFNYRDFVNRQVAKAPLSEKPVAIFIYYIIPFKASQSFVNTSNEEALSLNSYNWPRISRQLTLFQARRLFRPKRTYYAKRRFTIRIHIIFKINFRFSYEPKPLSKLPIQICWENVKFVRVFRGFPRGVFRGVGRPLGVATPYRLRDHLSQSTPMPTAIRPHIDF